MGNNKMACPNCKEILDKVNIDYVASINRSYNIEDKTLYYNDQEDEVSIDDIYMIYCGKCKSELPHELIQEIEGFVVKY